jgi:phosphatidylglycerophosphate synthase
MTYQFFEYFIRKFYSLRTKKDKLIYPLIKHTPTWVNPNTISAVRLFLALCLFLFYRILLIKHNQTYSLTILFVMFTLLGVISDLWDGALARARKHSSMIGVYIDSITDKVFILPILLIALYYFPWLQTSILYLYFFKVFLITVIIFNSFWRFDDFRIPRLRNYYARIYTAGYIILTYLLIKDFIRV